MTPELANDYLRMLVSLRLSDYRDKLVHGIRFGRCFGFVAALYESRQITFDQKIVLDSLAYSAGDHSGQPLPDARNAGPVIPARLLRERVQPLVKLQAQVLPNEPEQVSAPAPHTGLRLLCLLVTSRTGETCALPVHTMRPMPPAVLRPGRWSLASDPAFVLRETHAVRPPAEVLARYSRQRQTNAVCAPRAIV